MNQGLIHLYYGDGKGKTTAAIGLLVRALGRGKRCVLLQFLKGQDTGELAVLRDQPNLHILRGDPSMPFTFQMTPAQKAQTKALQDEQLRRVIDACSTGSVDLLVLDEVCAACSTGLLEQRPLRQFLAHKPSSLEVVLTGRNPPDFLLQAADYLTEMKAHRHPYERGIAAREGIEY